MTNYFVLHYSAYDNQTSAVQTARFLKAKNDSWMVGG